MSSSSTKVHFGVGSHQKVDSLRIVWPDGNSDILKNMAVDSLYTIDYKKSERLEKDTFLVNKKQLFNEVTNGEVLDFLHVENDNSDFRGGEPLLMHLYDFNGPPGLAAGDVNGDTRTDLYVGGARNSKGTIYLQNENGTFDSLTIEGSEKFEDLGALFFDADGDKDLDLYVVSGGSSVKYFEKGHYQDRLYFNNGNGQFEEKPDALPEIKASGSCVVAADYDSDGDLDLFVGGMMVPGNFPNTPNSYLLENNNGSFTDVTEMKAKGLKQVGMVSTALWSDYDSDGDQDLMVAGEWMPITVIRMKKDN